MVTVFLVYICVVRFTDNHPFQHSQGFSAPAKQYLKYPDKMFIHQFSCLKNVCLPLPPSSVRHGSDGAGQAAAAEPRQDHGAQV